MDEKINNLFVKIQKQQPFFLTREVYVYVSADCWAKTWWPQSLLNKVPWVPMCPRALSVRVSKCLGALVPESPKCSSASNAWVPVHECLKFPNAPVPKCTLSALQKPKCPLSAKCSSALQLPRMCECPLGVFKCTLRARMFGQIWLKQNAECKKVFYQYEQRQK